jgi:hypothetical protein
MNNEIKQDGKFRYIEEGEGEPLMLLHGLFGALSNFMDLINHFKQTHKVVVPMLPLLELDLLHTSVGGCRNLYSVLLSIVIIIVFTCLETHLAVMWRWFMYSKTRKGSKHSY